MTVSRLGLELLSYESLTHVQLSPLPQLIKVADLVPEFTSTHKFSTVLVTLISNWKSDHF